jgi:hypothetical protein
MKSTGWEKGDATRYPLYSPLTYSPLTLNKKGSAGEIYTGTPYKAESGCSDGAARRLLKAAAPYIYTLDHLLSLAPSLHDRPPYDGSVASI